MAVAELSGNGGGFGGSGDNDNDWEFGEQNVSASFAVTFAATAAEYSLVVNMLLAAPVAIYC